jgi:hypothetical protein
VACSLYLPAAFDVINLTRKWFSKPLKETSEPTKLSSDRRGRSQQGCLCCARLGYRWCTMPAGGSSESEAVHYSFVIVAALLIVGTVCLGESHAGTHLRSPSLPTSPGPLRLSMESWHAAQPLGVWNHRPRSRVRGCEPTLVGSPSTLFRCFLVLVSILYVWQTGSLSFVSQVTAPARRAVKHAFAFRRWGCACSIGRPR